MRAPAAVGETDTGDGTSPDADEHEPAPGTALLPVPRAAFLPQVPQKGVVARIEGSGTEPGPEPADAAALAPAAGGRRVRPAGLLLAGGGAAAAIAGLIVTAGLLTGGSESDDAGRGPAGISAGPSGGGQADGGPLAGNDGGGAPGDGEGAEPGERAGRDRGGDAPPDGRRAADGGGAAASAPGRTDGQIGSIAPTAPPARGGSHSPPSSSPTGGAPAPAGPPVLHPGDSGAEVTELQLRLRQVGLGLLQPADGTYDDGVRTSVRTFQSVNGLDADERGVYGPETRRELESRTDEP